MRLKGDLNGLIKIVRTSKDSDLKKEAILAMGRMQTPLAVPVLIDLFYDEDEDVPLIASTALTYIGRGACNELLQTFNEESEFIAQWSHYTLLQMNQDVVPDIIATLPELNEIGEERASYTLFSMGTSVLPQLINSLGSQEMRTAQISQVVIENIGYSALPALIEGLNHHEDEVKARVASLLIILGDRIVPDLLASCGHDQDATRDLKMYIISQIGSSALEPLYDALKDPNPVTSSMALKAFLEFGDAAMVPLIRGIFEKDSDLRKVAENALIRIGEPSVPHLISEIPLHKEQEREPIISILVRIGEPAIPYLITALYDRSSEISKTMIETLPRMGAIPAPYLLKEVEKRDPDKREPIRRVFTEIGRLAIPFLEDTIDMSGGESAVFAIGMIKDLDPVRAVDPLINALFKPDKPVRDVAISSLLQIGEYATPRLIYVMSSGNDVAMDLARSALIEIGEGAVPHLADALADPLTGDTQAIASIISEIGDDALPYIIPVIERGNPGRETALKLIRERGFSSVGPLMEALKRADRDLEESIKQLLGEIYDSDPEAFITYLIKNSEDWDDEIFEVLEKKPEQVIPSLIGTIKGGDQREAQIAGDILINYGSVAIQPLIKELRNQNEDHRLLITSMLVKIGPDAIPALISALQDKDIVVYAVAALGSIGEASLPSLLPILVEGDDQSAYYAGLAISRTGKGAIPPLLELFRSDESLIPRINKIFIDMGGVALPSLVEELRQLENKGEQGSGRGISLMSMILDISLPDQAQMRSLYSLDEADLVRMLTNILVSKGDVVIKPMIEALMNYSGTLPPLVSHTFKSLHNQAVTSLHSYMGELSDGDLKRIPLIYALGDLKDPSSAPIIFKALDDPDRNIRIAAVRELGKFGGKASGPLTAAMNDTDEGVRVAAVESMGYVGLSMLDQLLNAMKDRNGEIRAAAINGIAKVGDPAKFMLIQSLVDKDRRVRRDVVKLLDEIGWEPKYTTDKLSYLYAKEAWDTLIRIGPPSVDILSRGASDHDPDVRKAARDALEKIRSGLSA